MDMGLLFSAMLIGTVGLGVFIYGKRMQDVPSLGAGLALMVFPYFVHSVLLMWVITVVCLGALYALRRAGTA